MAEFYEEFKLLSDELRKSRRIIVIWCLISHAVMLAMCDLVTALL